MFEKIKALRDQFRDAKTDEERNYIQQETDKLREQDPDAWAEAMLACIKDTSQRASELLKRKKIEKIPNNENLAFSIPHPIAL